MRYVPPTLAEVDPSASVSTSAPSAPASARGEAETGEGGVETGSAGSPRGAKVNGGGRSPRRRLVPGIRTDDEEEGHRLVEASGVSPRHSVSSVILASVAGPAATELTLAAASGDGGGPTVGMNATMERGSGSSARDDVEAQLAPREGDDGGDHHKGDAGRASYSLSKRRKYYTVTLLTLTSMFLYADQNLISPNLSAVAEDFGFDDREKDLKLGGWLQLAFFVVGSPASFIIGWLSDKVPRTRLFFLTVLIGEGPCLATYWVKTYWELFAVRALTGIAVGGCLPLLFSITGDIFPAEERNYVASFLTIATGAGIAVGQIMAGTVGPAAGWRLPFILAAAPAIILATLLYFTVEEPPRGAQEEAVRRRRERRETEKLERAGRLRAEHDGDGEEKEAMERGGRAADARRQAVTGSAVLDRDAAGVLPGAVNGGAGDGSRAGGEGGRAGGGAQGDSRRGNEEGEDDVEPEDEYGAKIDMKKLWRQLKIPSNIIILAQGLPGTVPWGMLNAYFVDYLHVQKGLSVEAGTGAVTVFGLGATAGTIFGGIVGQRIYNRPGGRHAIALVMGLTTALGALPGYFFINVSSYGPGYILLYLSCLVGGVLAAVTPPNVRAVLLNVNPPETRGTMFAFYSQIDDVGKGGGPALVAGLIVAFGRRFAFNIAVSGWLVCGAVLLLLYPYIDADVTNAQRRVQEVLDAADDRAEAAGRRASDAEGPRRGVAGERAESGVQMTGGMRSDA